MQQSPVGQLCDTHGAWRIAIAPRNNTKAPKLIHKPIRPKELQNSN